MSEAPAESELFRRPLLRDPWFILGLVLALAAEVVGAWQHKVGEMIGAPVALFVVGLWRRELEGLRRRLRRDTSSTAG